MTKSPARQHTKDVEYEVANREAKLNKNATRITDAFDIYDGSVRIYRTTKSGDVYQFRMYIAEETRHKTESLRTRDKGLAIERAKRRFIEYQARLQNGEVLFSLNAQQLADKYLTYQEDRLSSGQISIGRFSGIKGHIKSYLSFIGKKTKISSFLVICLSALNIIFSSLLVLSFNLDVFGVALGTFLASHITAIAFIFFTYNFIKKKFKIIPKFEKIMIKSKLLKLFNINLDIFIRTLFLTFSFLWVTFLGSKLGEDYLVANTILMQFIILAAFFLDAYAFSTEGIVGFTIGRKNKKSFITVVKNSIQLSFFTALIISFLYFIFFKQIINLITDIDILRFISYQHIIWIILIPPLAAFCYQLDGIFIGASQTREIRNAMIVSVLIFITISIYLTKFFQNHGLWFSLLLFMILRSITLNFYFKKILRKF